MAAYLGLPYGGELGVEHLWIADAALSPELPIGWVEHTDEDDGMPFYQNVWTHEKMWEHPQVAALRGAVAVVGRAARLRQEVRGRRKSRESGESSGGAYR